MTPARRSALLVLTGLTLLLGACQSPKTPPPSAAPSLIAQAAEALEARDYAKAADLYRRAATTTPESLPAHYGLAVAVSYLDLKDEAIREFRWVMDRGPKGSPEVEAAQRWLAQAGVLAAQEPARPSRDEPGVAGEQASLEGRMTLTEPGQAGRPAQRRMVILYGLPNTPTKDERYQVRTDDEGRFKFPRLAPGTYMLTDAAAGARTWRLRVELKPQQAMTLDLTPANSTNVRDDFSG